MRWISPKRNLKNNVKVSCAFHCSSMARDGQYLKFMYLKYIFEIKNIIFYLNNFEKKIECISYFHWNQLSPHSLTLLQLEQTGLSGRRGTGPPRLSLVSPKVFSPFCHRWSFGSLPLSPLACLVGDTSFLAISSTSLHRYYLKWTELDDAITEFNNEMALTEKWVFNLNFTLVIHYFDIVQLLWHNLYC